MKSKKTFLCLLIVLILIFILNITAKAENFTIYITIDGKVIEGFDMNKLNYSIELPYGTIDVPVVDCVSSDSKASVWIIPTESLPGKTIVKIISGDETIVKLYNVNFNIATSVTDATLKELKVDGIDIKGFLPNKLDYSYEVQEGRNTIPIVTGALNNENAAVEVNVADEVPGTTKVKVIAEDGITFKEYSINFKLPIKLYVKDISKDNILLIGDYAFDLSISTQLSGYNLNNLLLAAQTAYYTQSKGSSNPKKGDEQQYQVYYRIGGKWYDIIGDVQLKTPINDLYLINGDGEFKYMNME